MNQTVKAKGTAPAGFAKIYSYSGLMVILGLVFLHWSQAMYFLAGNTARLGSLGLGFLLIVGAAWLRSGRRIFRHLPFFLVTGAYFAALALLTWIQEHTLWEDIIQQLFLVICIGLFYAGYLLARGKRADFGSPQQWSLVVVVPVACACLVSFLRYVRLISLTSSERGFGDTGLNPNGVAFAITVLALVFFVLGILNKSMWRKWMFLLVGILALFVVSTTASRGAILWGIGALIFLFIINRHQNRYTVKSFIGPVVSVAVMALAITMLFKSNYLVDDRVELLVSRFTRMFDHFGDNDADASMDQRADTWASYLRTWDQWIVFGEKNQQGYPHNQYIEIFVKFGLLGLPLFLMSVMVALRIFWSAVGTKIKPDFEFSLIATLFVFSYLQSMTSLSLQMNRTLWLGFGYLLGYYVQQAQLGRAAVRSAGVAKRKLFYGEREQAVAALQNGELSRK